VLSGRTGPVLDAVLSLRRRVRLAPGAAVQVAFTTAFIDTREEGLTLADKYHDFHGITRAFELAWAHSQVELHHLHLSAEEAHLFQRLATHVIFAGPFLRADPAVLAANHQGQPVLWRYGISGDKPIVLVRIKEMDELSLVRQLLLAHTYWRLKGLEVDLVILNEHATGYFEELHQQVLNLVRTSDAHALADKPGGVFLRKAAQIPEPDQVLLQAAARVVLVGAQGELNRQLGRLDRPLPLPALLSAPESGSRKEKGKEGDSRREWSSRLAALRADFTFGNGLGGFHAGGREYVIVQGEVPTADPQAPAAPHGSLTPAPWINVVANPSFGFLITESGGGYTWAGNSQANRLTPWCNDPVSDPPGEVVYLRDEATRDVWAVPSTDSRSRGPKSESRPWVCRHGQGYTRFEQTSHDLAQDLLLLVPADEAIKLIRLKVKNLSARKRRLSAAFYAEWVLGTVRDQAPMQVITEVDPESGAVLARNAFAGDFAGRVAFADVNLRPRSLTGDRAEFLGRNGSVEAPAALARVELSGRTGPAFDPCAALLAPVDLAPGEEKEVLFFLGQAADVEGVRRLLRRYREPGRVQAALDEVCGLWERILTAVQVKTPNAALDLLLNRWLLYQTLVCRMWARSAFYQSGGAYGFRDQLQDSMALVYAAPDEARAQILRAAGRQFREGDVQHWWHPPSGRGVRTRFSDDFLWLPFVTCHYVATTGDAALLDERVPYIEAPPLRPDQHEDYGIPHVSAETGTVYQHCARAVEHGLRFGSHGLPLMGTGDWNDGMNRVGVGGKGESVWNGWFLLTILGRFAELAEARGDTGRAARYRAEAERLIAAVEEHAWDGQWYRRAYFDDGTPLGSAQNDECRIDSLTQTWAVISGRADPARAREAMASVERLLVKQAEKMILLFTPPFDKGHLDPGYIKGYLPGIRENGGQYTHAATWVVQATALLGQGGRALELFDLLNPLSHAGKPEGVVRYRVEPYVVVADIYSEPPHVGRGGWTWYTGSAGWLYRVGLETILGFHLRGNRLIIDPCIARDWREFEITYRHRSATYHVVVQNPDGVERGVRQVTVDGNPAGNDGIELADDGRRHEVVVVLG
jgi:cyclic beta-1,2-glucan synthetase